MKILVCAATEKEVEGLLSHFEFQAEDLYSYANHNIDLLITGVGMMATAFHLAKKLDATAYDLAINCGICGAIDTSLQLAEVISVESDRAFEEGAEDGDEWLSIEDLGFRKANDFPYENGYVQAKYNSTLVDNLSIKKLDGISVNRVHGNLESIEKLKKSTSAKVESMEGAAFLYACRSSKVDCIQLRAVSNYVEKRNREAWEIEKALLNLAQTTLKLLKNGSN